MKLKPKANPHSPEKNTSKAVKSSKNKNPSTETADVEPNDDEIQRIDEALIQESHQSQVEQNSGNELTTENEMRDVNNVKSGQNYTQQKSPSVKSIFTTEDLTPDDEIYTLQCPQNYNKQGLYNKNINLAELKASITSKSEGFQINLLSVGRKFITLAVPKNASGGSLVKLPLKGHIIIQKVVDAPVGELMDKGACNKGAVVFPNDIKVRHPLLGIDWEDHVNLANAALSKCDLFRKKSKKKKREKIVDDDKVEIEKLNRESSQLESSPKKKRKKDK